MITMPCTAPLPTARTSIRPGGKRSLVTFISSLFLPPSFHSLLYLSVSASLPLSAFLPIARARMVVSRLFGLCRLSPVTCRLIFSRLPSPRLVVSPSLTLPRLVSSGPVSLLPPSPLSFSSSFEPLFLTLLSHLCLSHLSSLSSLVLVLPHVPLCCLSISLSPSFPPFFTLSLCLCLFLSFSPSRVRTWWSLVSFASAVCRLSSSVVSSFLDSRRPPRFVVSPSLILPHLVSSGPISLSPPSPLSFPSSFDPLFLILLSRLCLSYLSSLSSLVLALPHVPLCCLSLYPSVSLDPPPLPSSPLAVSACACLRCMCMFEVPVPVVCVMLRACVLRACVLCECVGVHVRAHARARM